MKVLWKTERSKGAYSRLLSPSEVLLKKISDLEPAGVVSSDFAPSRPIAYHFDFIEIFAGASLITKYLTEQGFSCGPPVELSASDQYNL